MRKTRNESCNRRFPAVLIPLTRGATGIKGEELPFGWSVNEICFWDQRGAFNGTNALPGLTRQPLIPSIPSSLSLSLYHYTSAVATTWYLSAFSMRTRIRVYVQHFVLDSVLDTAMYVFISDTCTRMYPFFFFFFFLRAFYAHSLLPVYTVGHKFRIICFYRVFSDASDESVLFRVQCS